MAAGMAALWGGGGGRTRERRASRLSSPTSTAIRSTRCRARQAAGASELAESEGTKDYIFGDSERFAILRRFGVYGRLPAGSRQRARARTGDAGPPCRRRALSRWGSNARGGGRGQSPLYSGQPASPRQASM